MSRARPDLWGRRRATGGATRTGRTPRSAPLTPAHYALVTVHVAPSKLRE